LLPLLSPEVSPSPEKDFFEGLEVSASRLKEERKNLQYRKEEQKDSLSVTELLYIDREIKKYQKSVNKMCAFQKAKQFDENKFQKIQEEKKTKFIFTASR
jgi:hypothetical protein